MEHYQLHLYLCDTHTQKKTKIMIKFNLSTTYQRVTMINNVVNGLAETSLTSDNSQLLFVTFGNVLGLSRESVTDKCIMGYTLALHAF